MVRQFDTVIQTGIQWFRLGYSGSDSDTVVQTVKQGFSDTVVQTVTQWFRQFDTVVQTGIQWFRQRHSGSDSLTLIGTDRTE